VGIMPAALFIQGGLMDHALTTFVYLHGFWGIDGVIKDYLVKFIPWIQKVWYLIAIFGFAGLINFNFNDIGVCKAIQMFWALWRDNCTVGPGGEWNGKCKLVMDLLMCIIYK